MHPVVRMAGVCVCLCLRGLGYFGGLPPDCEGVYSAYSFLLRLGRIPSRRANFTLAFWSKHLFFLNQTQPQMETEQFKGVAKTCPMTQR